MVQSFAMKSQLIDLDYTFTEPFMVKEIDTTYFKNHNHFHKDYELVLVTESTGKRIVGDHIEDFQDGDLVFLAPYLPHAWINDKKYYHENSNLISKSIVSYFKKSWLENEVLNLPEAASLKKVLENASRGIKLVGKTRQRISEILRKMPKSNGLKRSVDILSIFYELQNTQEFELLAGINYINDFSQNDAMRINNVYKYVLQNFSGHIRLDDVASIANMSPNAFCRYFKNHTSKNFSQFINEIRIGHACKLLQNKHLSMTEICFQSGFQSITNFNKFFKKTINKSPIKYRQDYLAIMN
jgi:AraC-like DNA-binding protein